MDYFKFQIGKRCKQNETVHGIYTGKKLGTFTFVKYNRQFFIKYLIVQFRPKNISK